MFSKLRSFAERHHRKFIVAGALIGGGILVKRYAERKLIEWQETEMNQLLERTRKQQHFESTERTCNMTITSVLPKIQLEIGRSLDSDSITLLLKQKAPNKKDLWEQLKVIAFSRLLCYIYGNAILAILLRAQVNILGAYLYLANQNPSKPDLELNPEAQGQFLSASNHWLSTGVEQFCLVSKKPKITTLSYIIIKNIFLDGGADRVFSHSEFIPEATSYIGGSRADYTRYSRGVGRRDITPTVRFLSKHDASSIESKEKLIRSIFGEVLILSFILGSGY